MSLAHVLPPTLPASAPSPEGAHLGALVARFGGVERPLPLRAVRVRATVMGPVAQVDWVQRFANPFDEPLEAVHIFPLPPGGAVAAAWLRAGDVEVRFDCAPRAEAEATFAAAREAGHRAALLTQERADVHTLEVTRLPPRTEAEVHIRVEMPLDIQDGDVVLRLPMVVAPRYTPGAPIGHDGSGVSPDTEIVPDASRLSPPVRVAGGTPLDLEVRVCGPVRRVRVGQHTAVLELDDGGVRVAPSGATLDRDFLLHFRPGSDGAAPARAWSDGRHTLVLVDGDAPAPVVARDVVFLVDISGSMDGEKIVAARAAVRGALRGLSAQDRFRIIAFDDRVEPMSNDFLPLDDHTLTAADRWVGRLAARGGTELAPALAAALQGPTPPGRLRTVLLVTDGQSNDEAQLLQVAAHQRRGARVFPLGIDTAVNAALLEQVARVGGGVATFCTPADDIDAVVAGVESRFGAPLACSLAVEVSYAGAVPDFVPAGPPPAWFRGRPAVLLLEGARPTVAVVGSGGPVPLRWELPCAPAPFPLAALFARARVQHLEDRLLTHPIEGAGIAAEGARVALAAGIASRWTALVAVDNGVSSTGAQRRVVQPVERPHLWPASPAVLAGAAAPSLFASAAPSRSRAGGGAPPPPAAAPAGPPRAMSKSAPAPAPSRGFGESMKRLRAMVFRDDDSDGLMSSARGEPEAEAAAPLADAAAPAPAVDVGELVRGQRADGSFGGAAETAAVVLALAALGHTRSTGVRQRNVKKAVEWLDGAAPPWLPRLLALLDALESGEVPEDAAWEELFALIGPPAALSRRARGG